jgi:hypothetical protein
LVATYRHALILLISYYQLILLWFQYYFDVYLQELKPKSNNSKGKGKSRGFESDEDSPPKKKPTTHRRMTVVSDSDDE